MNTAMEDEILSINAIYSSETLVQELKTSNVLLLKLPSANCTLRLSFPSAYPEEPPSVLGPSSSGSDARKGLASEIAKLARDALLECFTPGVPCIFGLIEYLTAKMPHEESEPKAPTLEFQDYEARVCKQESKSYSAPHDPARDWIISETITEKKSVFVARAVRISSPDEARSLLNNLLAMDKKVAKATHNITAWRIKGEADVVYQDCDDDGEAAAGGRLLHLLQMMGVWNVMVVVSRWYGGIKLGPDRFRLINCAARDCLVKGGLIDEAKK